MNDNAQKWVKALRRRRKPFKQGTGQLRKADAYCCLGVACELYRQETGKGQWLEDVGQDAIFIFVGDDHFTPGSGTLPGSVRDWLGLRHVMGDYREGCLAELNDTGKTFRQIAKVIVSEPVGLFVDEA